MSTIIESIEQAQVAKVAKLRRFPRFDAGDRVRVHFQVIEGQRKRTQVFEGIVIKRQGSGLRETFAVRKQSFGVGVERTFPVNSPKIEKLEVAARGKVRRAKLYYLRDRVGKAARVAERRWGIEDELVVGELPPDPEPATEAPATEQPATAEPAPEEAAEEPVAVSQEPGAVDPAAAAEPEAAPDAAEPEVAEAADSDSEQTS